MYAKFFVEQSYSTSSLPMFVSGEVVEGEIHEGNFGTTPRGKKCSVVQIEEKKTGTRITIAKRRAKVNIYLKNVNPQDIKTGDIIGFV